MHHPPPQTRPCLCVDVQPWFLHPDYLRGCKPVTQTFFGGAGYCGLYSAAWRSNLVEHMKYKGLVDMIAGKARRGGAATMPGRRQSASL